MNFSKASESQRRAPNPLPRSGHRILSYGRSVYSFGGYLEGVSLASQFAHLALGEKILFTEVMG